MSAAVPQLPSYASGTSDVPLLGETIGDNFDRAVAADPDREALVEVPTGRRWTYAQLRADVDALALGLLADGVAKGDRVGIWAPNMAEWTLLQYATAKIGAILVNINPSYRTHELEYVLRQAGVAWLVSAREFKTSDYAAMIEQVRGNCPELRAVVLIGSAEWDGLLTAGRGADPAELKARQAAQSRRLHRLARKRAVLCDQHLDGVFPGVLGLGEDRDALRQEPAAHDQHIADADDGTGHAYPGELEEAHAR